MDTFLAPRTYKANGSMVSESLNDREFRADGGRGREGNTPNQSAIASFESRSLPFKLTSRTPFQSHQFFFVNFPYFQFPSEKKESTIDCVYNKTDSLYDWTGNATVLCNNLHKLLIYIYTVGERHQETVNRYFMQKKNGTPWFQRRRILKNRDKCRENRLNN